MAKALRKRDIFNTLVVSFTLGIDLLSGAREIWKFTLPLMYYELICTLDYFNIWVCLLWAGENLRSLRSSLKLVDPSQHIPSKIEVDVSKLDTEDKVLKQEVLFCFLLVNSSTDERSARFYIGLGSTSVCVYLQWKLAATATVEVSWTVNRLSSSCLVPNDLSALHLYRTRLISYKPNW